MKQGQWRTWSHVFEPNEYGVEHTCAAAGCYRYKDDPLHVQEQVNNELRKAVEVFTNRIEEMLK